MYLQGMQHNLLRQADEAEGCSGKQGRRLLLLQLRTRKEL
jgi:hypothetical protein